MDGTGYPAFSLLVLRICEISLPPEPTARPHHEAESSGWFWRSLHLSTAVPLSGGMCGVPLSSAGGYCPSPIWRTTLPRGPHCQGL